MSRVPRVWFGDRWAQDGGEGSRPRDVCTPALMTLRAGARTEAGEKWVCAPTVLHFRRAHAADAHIAGAPESAHGRMAVARLRAFSAPKVRRR